MAINPQRYAAYAGYLVASDNSYSVPISAYSSNIKTQMTQAENLTNWLISRSSLSFPSNTNPSDTSTKVSSSMWFLEPSAPTNVAFNTFDDTTSVATGLPQQMSPFIDVNTAVWGIYFPAITGQGQLAAAVGKIQVYGTTVTGLAGAGNTPTNATSATAFLALANKIGDKYAATSATENYGGFGSDGPYASALDATSALLKSGAIISLNGAPIYTANI
jgi:hypothetical protein